MAKIPKTPKTGGLTQKIGELMKKGAESKAIKNRSKKSIYEGRAKLKEAQAKLASAKQGYKKTQAIATGLAVASGNIASGIQKRNTSASNAMQEALAQYNAIITNNAQPAEGTGSASPGTSKSGINQGA